MICSNMSDKLVLGYYNTRGLAETIRTLLVHLDIDYEDRMYDPTLPSQNPESWLYQKFNLGFEFPNLPYLLDNGFKLTQSKAILQYICRKYKPEYLGGTIEEQSIVNMLGDLCHDLNLEISNPTFDSNWEQLKQPTLEKIDQTLRLLNSFLQAKQFLLGDNPTWPDFYLYEVLQKIQAIRNANLSDTFETLSAFMEKMQTLENLQRFESSRSRKFFSSASYSGI